LAREITINLGYLLYGEEFEIISSCNLSIDIETGVITSIGSSWRGGAIELKWAIAIPSLANLHIHTADYAFQEAGLELTLHELVSEPNGLKHKLLKTIDHNLMVKAIRKVLLELISQGVALAIDFREGGLRGIKIAKEASKDTPITYIPLCRPTLRPVNEDELLELRRLSNGVGISTPVAYTEKDLNLMYTVFKDGIRATHVAEDPKCHELGDYELAANKFKANIIVHGVHLDPHEISDLSQRKILLVLCPRSNLWFSAGIPPIAKFIEKGVLLALGTDNAGWIKPDIWRELETTWNIIRLQKPTYSNAKLLLSMVTLNPARTLKTLNIGDYDGIVKEGAKANIIFASIHDLGLEFSHNKYASIIKRCSKNAIKTVMYQGLVVKTLSNLYDMFKDRKMLHRIVSNNSRV